MNKESLDISSNPFLSRGCCAIPNENGEGNPYNPRCAKLDSQNWLNNITSPTVDKEPLAEVRFKNSKKEFFKLSPEMSFKVGDIIAVEGSPGHDIGIVTLMGETAKLQFNRRKIKGGYETLKKVYRLARTMDIEKWVAAVSKEEDAILGSRLAAGDLSLNMKINDVEYQGDGTKAIFYYTAEERVDFRELIKILADKFRVRIEMKQIGARQEAARLGGIGSCGRELCCATWHTEFTSVTTNNARTQQLSLNPSKLAGQCGKLKCCLNFVKDFPRTDIVLKTKKGDAQHQKIDVFKRICWYSYTDDYNSMMAIPVEKVKEIIALNKNGKLPAQLEDYAETKESKNDYGNSLEEMDLKRFDEDLI
jgi:cell fate regulator YaaT (PSP1 superfamily)